MNALTIIRREHRDLGMTLLSFESYLNDIGIGKHDPDVTFFRAVINYLESFLNRFHHPKEDEYLFPALLNRHPAAEPLVHALQKDHHNGDLYCRQLADTLTRYESNQINLDEFQQSALNYIRYERLHIKKEELELLPLARKHLDESDWAPIDEADIERWDTAGDDPTTHTPVLEFAVKLSRLRDMLYTQTGQRMAENRHAYMASFFERLHAEVRGNA